MFITFIFLLLAFTTGPIKADQCTTPNNETAYCISLYNCPILLQAIADSTRRNFVQQSNCGGTPIEPMVCCGTQSNFTEVQKKPERNLLPSRKICGLQHSDDYFHTLNDTSITEFPWLAIIIKSITGTSGKFYCTGSLINNKFVLTTAKCASSEFSEIDVIRLGEYHFNNSTDCVEESQLLECSDPLSEFGVKKIIVHPNYTYNNHPHDNLALIKLNKSVQYSDYIRPICLPLPETKLPTPGDILIQSGWAGAGYNFFYPTGVKKRASIKIIGNKACDDYAVKPSVVSPLEESVMCGLAEDKNIKLTGSDQGGPLLYYNGHQWYQEGIASDNSFFVNVYVKVAGYLDWIKDSLES